MILVFTNGASRGRIVPPAMRARGSPADLAAFQRSALLPHTRRMRQWACVVALLLGLAGNGYVASVRVRLPVAIERRLEPRDPAGGTVRTLDWWRA